MSFPVTRPMGRALVVANPFGRAALVEMLGRLGFDCTECDDPYTATIELSRLRLAYRALILSLASMYREELTLITTVKQRFPHVEVWLAHTDGRQAALAESMRLGADGLLDDEGAHRIATAQPIEPPAQSMPQWAVPMPPPAREAVEAVPEIVSGEPVLTAEELRALLQDQPATPPAGEQE